MDEVKSTLELWFGMKFGDKTDTRFRHYFSSRVGISWSLEGQAAGTYFLLDLNNGSDKKICFVIVEGALLPDSDLDKINLIKLVEKLKMIEKIYKAV